MGVSRQKSDRRRRGFTLLEMSVVLVILAVIAVGAMTIASTQAKNNQAAVTSSRLDAIEAAVASYVTTSGFEPCPASTLISLDDTNTTDDVAYGVSTGCAQLATIPGSHIEDTGTYDIRPAGGSASGADDIRMGSVPVRTLSLPDSYVYDGWGNRFTYVTIKSLSRNSATATAYAPPVGLTTGVIKITDSAGNQVPDASATTIVPYAVISHGPLGHGAIPHMGGTFAACASSWAESKNCDLDEIFLDTRYNDSTATPANYFTNQIRWKEKQNLWLPVPPPTPVVLTPLSDDSYDSFRLDKAGKLWVAGLNQFGGFGNGTNNNPGGANPATSSYLRGGTSIPSFQSIASGGNSAFGIDQYSHLYCWGQNGQGQCGIGDTSEHDTPVAVMPTTTWNSASITPSSACAITAAGALYCMGYNNYYELGYSPNIGSSIPVHIGSDTTWTSVSLGGFGGGGYTCGVDNGLGYCWGGGHADSSHLGSWLGQGTGVPVAVAPPAQISGGITNWKVIVAGYVNTCGITQTGALYCWGQNANGQVGDGTTTERFVPTSIGTGWSSIAAEKYYGGFCAIKTNGTLWCWGANNFGELGTGDSTERHVPTQVGSATDWTNVSMEFSHACGLRGGKNLYCWGNNWDYVYGDGSSDGGSYTPEAIATPFSFQ